MPVRTKARRPRRRIEGPTRLRKYSAKRDFSITTVEPNMNSVHGVSITHADRLIDPASGVTKGRLASYYGLVAHRVLAFAHRRPLAIVRCPEGVERGCFFQKHAPHGLGDEVRRDRIGKQVVLDVDSPAGLIALVQFGAVELHGWGSRLPNWQKPDWIVFDLDPDEGLPFSKVVRAAKAVRLVLGRQGLVSFVKTTGGKGLHVVVPVIPRAPFEGSRAFARAVADALVERDSSSYTATASKKERRGKIFIDYLRNGEGATAVLPFSVRARPNLPVAMPIAWDSLDRVDPAAFTAASLPTLLAKRRKDPWEDFATTKQELPDSATSPSTHSQPARSTYQRENAEHGHSDQEHRGDQNS